MNILFLKEVYDKIGKIKTQKVEGRLLNEISNVEGQMMIKKSVNQIKKEV